MVREQDCEQLEKGEEGIKLLVKGKLKNIPDIEIKKPKTEKEKQEQKERREQKKENKKLELSQLANEIQKNFEKFQSTKQIAQQQTQQQIPIYIPQYTEPTGRNLNVSNLTEINNMILEKENELKEFYENQFKKNWSEIEESYRALEDRALEEDREIAFREPELLEQTQLPPQYIPPPVPQTPSIIDDFELLPKPTELTPSQEFEYEPEQKSFADNVVDLLGIFDQEVLNKFKNNNKKNETLQEINEEQQTIIDSKQNQLDQLNETIELMEQSVNLSKNDIDKLESELLNKMNEINTLTDENEKLRKIKEAEILSLELNSAENINELQEQLDIVKNEKLQTEKELETLKLLNAKENDKKEFVIEELLKEREAREEDERENITQAERELLNVDDENVRKREFLSKYIRDKRKIPTNKGRLKTMYELFNEIIKDRGEDILQDRVNFILFQNPNIKQTDFINELLKERKSIADLFKAEEERQQQIINERVAEAENEEKLEILGQIDNQLKNISNEFNRLTIVKEQKMEEIDGNKNELEDLINEYENLLLTLEKVFEDAGINKFEDIEDIEDENERQTLTATIQYINDTKDELKEAIENIKNLLIQDEAELERLDINLIEKEDQIKDLKIKSENVKKTLL